MGNAFLFVPLLAMTWIVGLFLAMIASHHFLSVMESAGQGNEKIEMPDEPFVDWVGKVVYLAVFVILWGIPSLIVMAATRGMDETSRFIAIVFPFWLFFPIGMLSPMCLKSRWMPFWPGLIPRMLQRLSATIQLYLLSAPACFGFCFCFWQLTQSETSYASIFINAIFAAMLFLTYAFLIGRYGFVLTFTKGLFNEPEKKPKKPRRRPRPVEEAPAFVQPTEMHGVYDPFGEEVTGYGVNIAGRVEETPAPKPTVDEEESYIIEDGLEVESTPSPGSKPTATNPEALKPPAEEEIKMYLKNRQVKEPTTPFGADTFAGFANPAMLSGMLTLAAISAVFSVLIHFMSAVRPI